MLKSGYILGMCLYHRMVIMLAETLLAKHSGLLICFHSLSLFSQLFPAVVSAINGFLLVLHSLSARLNVDLCCRLTPQRAPKHLDTLNNVQADTSRLGRCAPSNTTYKTR